MRLSKVESRKHTQIAAALSYLTMLDEQGLIGRRSRGTLDGWEMTSSEVGQENRPEGDQGCLSGNNGRCSVAGRLG